MNYIDADGAEYLADALQINTVGFVILRTLYVWYDWFIDVDDIDSLSQSYHGGWVPSVG